jgi:DNA-binding transcriptional LysR family regulator
MGELVVRHATALDAAARDLDREIRLAQDLELGELRVGAGPWGGSVLVAPVVGRLNARHPGLRMRVVVAPWRELPARTRARDVDLMVGGLGDVAHLDDFEFVRLGVHDTVVVGRVGHPLDVDDDATPADVFTYPLVGPGMDADASDLLVALGRALGDGPAGSPDASRLLTIECDSSDVLKRLLLESDALTFMPRFLAAPAVGEGALTVIENATVGPRVEFGVAWLRGRSLGRAGTAFLDLLRDHHAAISAQTA